MQNMMKAIVLIGLTLGPSLLAQEQTIKRVNLVEIGGGKTFDSRTLKAQLRRVKDGTRLNTATIEWDIEVNVKGFLKEHGFLHCTVTFAEIPRTEQDVDIRITVSEGPQYRLGSLDFKGNRLNIKVLPDGPFRAVNLANVFDIHPGDIVNTKKIKSGLDNVKQIYENSGYLQFSYIPEQVFDDQHGTMSLSVTIDPGTYYFISYVAFVGCRDQTQEEWLKTELAKGSLRPNLLFMPVLLKSETDRLKKTTGLNIKAFTEIVEQEGRVGILFWIYPSKM
jgi:outer membrane protein assembly factor BamA